MTHKFGLGHVKFKIATIVPLEMSDMSRSQLDVGDIHL